MAYLAVVVAAAAAWAFGAVWYMLLSKPWIAASGVKMDGDRGTVRNVLPFVLSFLLLLLVAGMIRHVLVSGGISTLGSGALAGGGLGLFVAAPWIAMNNLYADRPLLLTLIDGGYAAIGCTIIGAVLTLI